MTEAESSPAKRHQTAEEPVVGGLLALLAQDMADHPERIAGIDAALLDRIRPLVKDVSVDLDAALTPAD